MRKTISLGLVASLALVIVAGVTAANINGTPRNDTLKGSAKADKIDGKAGNDKLYGLAGNDVLIGGAGNDLLVGGPGGDNLNCGPGNDKAQADDADNVSPTCESVTGITPPAISIAGASVTEGNSGSSALSFKVSLSKAAKRPVSVNYATANGSATAPADYASASGKLTFAPGESSKTIDVAVVGDTAIEQDETLTISLSGPVNATIAAATATGTIKNDDVGPRSGRYSGMTSQGKPISFDVSPDLKTLSNGSFGFDLNCSVPGFTVTDTFDLPPIDIGPDWSFGARGTYSDSQVSIVVEFSGQLTVPGSASGTLKIQLDVYGVPGYGTVRCGTGATPVTWNAS